jgi:hypothetical protein
MGEDPRPHRIPGGALPRRLARPTRPETNGHSRHRAVDLRGAGGDRPEPHIADERPLGLNRAAWEDLDAEDDQRLQAERTAFRRVAEVASGAQVDRSGRPSAAVIAAVLVVVAVVLLAVLLYRMAPP